MLLIDTNNNMLLSTVPVNNEPTTIELNPSNNDIYVINRGSRTVSVIDGLNNTLLINAEVGTEPVDLLFNPSNNDMYVANVVSNSVTILDSTNNNTVADTINVNSLPLALEFNLLTMVFT
jgi:YVTN family beta-propeller protein